MRSHFFVRTLVGALFIGLAGGCAAGHAGQRADTPTVTAEDIANRPDVPIDHLIQTKAPGVIVGRTRSGAIMLQIRGSSPFSDNNGAPLYVINGTPIEAGPDGAMPDINPYDIESIKVLKGAETTLYGIQGAYGVIVITMKKPARRN